MIEKIDFVITWVDGSDPEWLRQKAKYSGKKLKGDEAERFRDWDQLKYWFRGVEKFAPWVNKIHFITCGHVPSWLNLEHPKLHWVKHEDYIPAEYLPVFSSNPIELNIHRIEGLSEHFVYFNDDFFLIDRVKPEDFFRDGVPCSSPGLAIISPLSHEYAGILYRCYTFMNKHFSSRQVMKKQIGKFLHPANGLKRNLLTLLLLPYCTEFFPGFHTSHAPNAFLKATLEEIWKTDPDALHDTCTHRFRSCDDLAQNIFSWWQWCKGQVVPQNARKKSTYLTVLSPDEQIQETIGGQVTPIVVINDDQYADFEHKKAVINGAFESILSEKSSFEK